MSKRPAMLASLRARYEADIAEADTTINIYLDNLIAVTKVILK